MNQSVLTDHAALLLRVSLGVMAIAHGALKIFVFTIPGTVAFFESQGYPAILAYAVMAFEMIGGAALIAGVWTRIVSLGFVPILIGATITHAGNGWVFSAENGGWEYPVFLLVAFVVQALLGGGAYELRRDPAVGRLAVA